MAGTLGTGSHRKTSNIHMCLLNFIYTCHLLFNIKVYVSFTKRLVLFYFAEFSSNNIYIISIVKCSYRPILNLFNFLQQTSMDFCKVYVNFFSHFTIEEREIFENKSFIMFCKRLWKPTTIKILVYTVKASCVILAFKLNWEKFIMKIIDLFFQLQDYNSWW